MYNVLMLRLRPGGWGWVGIGVGVIGYDVWALKHDLETLSEVFGQALDHPQRKWLAWGLAVYVPLHLCGSHLPLPEAVTRLDPLSYAAQRIKSVGRAVLEE